MASSVILRKLVPCAARLLSSRRIRPSNACLAPATAFPCHRDFSASAATDNKLVEAIESEIQTTLHSHYPKQHFPFQITNDFPMVNHIIRLEREYEGETITVKVINGGCSTEYHVNVTVEKKKKGATLKLYCAASPDKIKLYYLTMHEEENIKPYCNRLYPSLFKGFSESLKETFLEYLDVRGVNTSMINFLHERKSIDADYLARITWLNELKTTVEA